MREVPHVLRVSLVCVCGENETEGERESGRNKTKTCREELTKECATNVRSSWHNESYTMRQQSMITGTQTVDSSLYHQRL
jgi:hypothetical protein